MGGALIIGFMASMYYLYLTRDANIGRTYSSRWHNSKKIGEHAANVGLFVFAVVFVLHLILTN